MFTHCLNSTKIARYCRALIGFGLRRKSRVLWRWIFGVLAKCYLSLGVSVYSGFSLCLTLYCMLDWISMMLCWWNVVWREVHGYWILFGKGPSMRTWNWWFWKVLLLVVLPMDENGSIWLWIIFHKFRFSVGVELVIN